MSDTYASVDDAEDVAGAIEWQERIDAWPQIQAYKLRSFELVATSTGGLVLDAGAGTGVDAASIGGRVVAVDRSIAMCARARSRGVTVCRADVGHLPFATGAFSDARADRVLQHLDDPSAAMDELVRVVAPGGRVVICDPSQGSLVVAVPGVRPALVAEITRLRRDRGLRNGRLAAALPAMLHERGLGDITVDAFPLMLTDPDDAFGLPGWVRYWRDVGPFTDDDVREWDSGIDRARAGGGFVYALLYFVVSGLVPELNRP